MSELVLRKSHHFCCHLCNMYMAENLLIGGNFVTIFNNLNINNYETF